MHLIPPSTVTKDTARLIRWQGKNDPESHLDPQARAQPQAELNHAYDNAVCYSMADLDKGNPRCQVVVDKGGLVQATTGSGSKLSNRMVNQAIHDRREHRMAFIQEKAKRETDHGRLVSGLVGHKHPGSETQTTGEFLMSSPDLWVAAAAVGLGATFIFSTA